MLWVELTEAGSGAKWLVNLERATVIYAEGAGTWVGNAQSRNLFRETPEQIEALLPFVKRAGPQEPNEEYVPGRERRVFRVQMPREEDWKPWPQEQAADVNSLPVWSELLTAAEEAEARLARFERPYKEVGFSTSPALLRLRAAITAARAAQEKTDGEHTEPRPLAETRHPVQPLVTDEDGRLRFKQNAIVRYLLDAGPFDMNQLATLPCSREDRVQFAQLIGYSLDGFGELDYVTDEDYAAAQGETG